MAKKPIYGVHWKAQGMEISSCPFVKAGFRLIAFAFMSTSHFNAPTALFEIILHAICI